MPRSAHNSGRHGSKVTQCKQRNESDTVQTLSHSLHALGGRQEPHKKVLIGRLCKQQCYCFQFRKSSFIRYPAVNLPGFSRKFAQPRFRPDNGRKRFKTVFSSFFVKGTGGNNWSFERVNSQPINRQTNTLASRQAVQCI